MSRSNKHLTTVVPAFYRWQTFHVMIFTFMDTYRFVYPSVTLQEAASAFMHRYQVAEDDYNVDSVIATYLRINQDLNNAQRETR